MFMFALKIYGSDVLILYLGNIDYDGDLITSVWDVYYPQEVS